MSLYKVGYARVSTDQQNLENQIDELEREGCLKIFFEVVSSQKSERSQMQQCLAYLRGNDTLVVTSLDRLARSVKELTEMMHLFQKRGIHLYSMRENMDTSTPSGKFIFHVYAALAEFERELIRERTLVGLKAARARGRLGGRPPKLTPLKKEILISMYQSQKYTLKEIAEEFGVSLSFVCKLTKKSI